jgi:hypothetical protein
MREVKLRMQELKLGMQGVTLGILILVEYCIRALISYKL